MKGDFAEQCPCAYTFFFGGVGGWRGCFPRPVLTQTDPPVFEHEHEQALPDAERRTAEAIGSATGIDDNAAVEAIKADRQHANHVRGLPCFTHSVYIAWMHESTVMMGGSYAESP